MRKYMFLVFVLTLMVVFVQITALTVSGQTAPQAASQVTAPMDVSDEAAEEIEKAIPAQATAKPERPRKILVYCNRSPYWDEEASYFNTAVQYWHEGIPYFNRALKIMGEKTGAFSVDITTDANDLLAENLVQYDAICLNNTVSTGFSPESTPEICKSIMDFVNGGKGLIGIHATIDNFYNWPGGQELMGNVFTGFSWAAGRGAWSVKIDEPDNPLMMPFKDHKGFKIRTEIYRTWPPVYSRDKQLVLMSLNMDDATTQNATLDERDQDTGISWIKQVGEGRVFYCSLGHGGNITTMAPIMEHYLLGIQWALGDLKGVDATPKGVKTD